MPRRAPAAALCIFYATMDSPLGPICLAGTAAGLIRVDFQDDNRPVHGAAVRQDAPGFLGQAVHQLQEYFQGQRQSFTLPLAPPGTPFQQRVWRELQHIPFGTTLTYRAFAQRLGMPQAARAVGQANGRNPLAIVIPCHRLIGSDGQLRGYAGGLDRKRYLIQHEGVMLS